MGDPYSPNGRDIVTKTYLVTDRAVKGVVDQEELHDPLPGLPGEVRVGVHLPPLGTRAALVNTILKHAACALIHHFPAGLCFHFHSWRLKENDWPSQAEVIQRSSNILRRSS